MANIKHALGTVLHELVDGATSLVENRKGELHELIEDVLETLGADVVEDVEGAADEDATPAKHAEFTKAPADGAASA